MNGADFVISIEFTDGTKVSLLDSDAGEFSVEPGEGNKTALLNADSRELIERVQRAEREYLTDAEG